LAAGLSHDGRKPSNKAVKNVLENRNPRPSQITSLPYGLPETCMPLIADSLATRIFSRRSFSA